MGEPRNILVIYGTRPEIIKLAPVIDALRADSDFHASIVATGQHRELASLAQSTFGIEPDACFDIMSENQWPGEVHSRALGKIKGWIAAERKWHDRLAIVDRGRRPCALDRL